MTMKQIIESLEICNGDNEKGCESCSLFGRLDCGMHLQRETLALIREQKASILRHKCRIRLLESDVSAAKYDAVKEFAKLLIDSSKDGEINASDMSDYVVEYLEGGSDER